MRRADLPPTLDGRPFSVREALALGVSAGRLDAADLDTPFRGVRVPRGLAVDSLLARCEQYAPRLRPWQFFSHETALALVGAPTPRAPRLVGLHVSAHRPAREPRIAGITGHRLQVRADASILVRGFPVEHPVRAWRQCGPTWSHDDLVAAADHLIGTSELATVEELREEVRDMRGAAAARLNRALADARIGSASSEETRLRLVLARAGLPDPELNWELRDDRGRLVAILDLAFRRWRIDVEYNGRQHADDMRQYRRDVDRRAALRRLGWDEVTILSHHLRGDGRLAVQAVREALTRAGWRGER